jgi:elongation factor P--(R)-beta-lysine ligase
MDSATMRRRARLIGGVRSFFDQLGYTEVDTPLLAPHLIPEPAIEVFPVRSRGRSGAPERELYLVPSPELWMKRLLASGSGSIYQICHCFRNVEESGKHHAPEFTMLEWYTTDHTYLDSAALTQGLLRRVGIDTPVAHRSMAELFALHAGLDLASLEREEDLRSAAGDLGIAVSPESDWEECFNKVFLTLVEPRLAEMGAVIVLDYPWALPTLARRKPGTPWAERWELYIDGVEIANCYTEETDPRTLEALAARESARKVGAAFPHPPDPDIARIALPACSGVALGLDRLLMRILGLDSLDQVIFFPGFGIL